MLTFYNEIDHHAASWLRELMSAGQITKGIVDERSITDLRATDLTRHRRVHLFAGIGGWDYALKLAGWPVDRDVWTGSCPCQPFSSAGKGLGEDDPRHLWPLFRGLIAECKPATIFGEQVIGKSNLGIYWFNRVRTDLEALGYAVGGADLCASGVGAPHRRQRIFWVANTERDRWMQSTKNVFREKLQPSICGQDGDFFYSEGTGFKIRKNKTLKEQKTWSRSVRTSAWDDYQISWFNDPNKGIIARRIGSGVGALAHGVPGRVGLLRGYGNAIVPQVAAEFIRAFLEVDK